MSRHLCTLVIFALAIAACSSPPPVETAEEAATSGAPFDEPTGDPLPGVAVPTGDPGEAPADAPADGPAVAPLALCFDEDGDGRGPGCALGPDCDDGDPTKGAVCPDCPADPAEPVEGCPCAGGPVVCGPPEAGTGVCAAGVHTCEGGAWTGCVGAVGPAPEICDELDNDCDGETDEGVKSACGDCDPLCGTIAIGPDVGQPFALHGVASDTVETTAEGYLSLVESSHTLRVIWIANSGEHTVSKLDTVTGRELGRYAGCKNPSRTAVAKSGDGWVACRDDGGVMQIATRLEDCVDRNGDGQIQTCQDANDDGTIQPSEMVADDECVRFTVHPLGGGIGRALGVDAESHAWAGFWEERKLVRLEPTEGKTVATIELGEKPYGLAIDPSGVLWVCAREAGLLLRVDPQSGAVTKLKPGWGCFEPYGITVDEQGGVWLANAWCDDVAWRYDPESGAWSTAQTDNTPRGVAPDGKGRVYVANDDSHRVAKVDIATMQTIGYANLGNNRKPVGVAVDSQGFVWAINQNSSSASKIDPETLEVLHEQPVGKDPYTYSDMTGQTFFAHVSPEGSYVATVAVPSHSIVVWRTVAVDYDAPQGTRLELRFRAAATQAALAVAPWSDWLGPFPPETFPVDLPPYLSKAGGFLQIELALFTESSDDKPTVKLVEVAYATTPEAAAGTE